MRRGPRPSQIKVPDEVRSSFLGSPPPPPRCFFLGQWPNLLRRLNWSGGYLFPLSVLIAERGIGESVAPSIGPSLQFPSRNEHIQTDADEVVLFCSRVPSLARTLHCASARARHSPYFASPSSPRLRSRLERPKAWSAPPRVLHILWNNHLWPPQSSLFGNYSVTL